MSTLKGAFKDGQVVQLVKLGQYSLDHGYQVNTVVTLRVTDSMYWQTEETAPDGRPYLLAAVELGPVSEVLAALLECRR